MSQPSNYSSVKNAMEVLSECIKSGSEIKNLCENCTNATIKSHPIFKKLFDKIIADTKAIEKLKSMIDVLQKSANGNDYKKWRSEFGNVINSLETASNDTIVKVSHAVASSGTKKIKKSFEETERIFSDTDLSQIKDEASRNFMNVLMERNQKVVECLKYAESLLPKFFKVPTKKNRKLFIIGDDSSRSMSFSKNYEHLGEVIIISSLPSSTGMSNSQSVAFRDSLNGYLIDDINKTEVMLKLIAADNSIDLMEFSKMANNSELVKLSATIKIDGEIDEGIEIVEISLTEDYQSSKGPEAMAIVENNQTGGLNRVPIQIVPISPQKEIHGKILEIQPMTEGRDKTELLEEIEMPSFNSTFKEESPMRLPYQFATPSRVDRDARKQALHSPSRGQRFNLSLPTGRLAIDQLIENVAEKAVNSIIKDQSILEDVSEIEYANLSSYYEPNQSAKHVVPNRIIETSGRGNLEDISEIEYANLSASYHPHQSARNSTMPSPRKVINTSAIRRTPNKTNISMGRNLEDVSEIEYANISSVYEPNASNRSKVNNMSIRSPQRRTESSIRQQESRLEDISEIDFANLSSFNQSVRNRSVPMAPKSPQRRIDTSLLRQGGNLEDISEIEYANLSGSFHPNQSARKQVIVSPQRVQVPSSPQRKLQTSDRANLEDISEIEYADMSSVLDQSQSNRSRGNNVSMTSSRRMPETSMRRQESRLEDISEIDYANLSSAYHPNRSAAMSPKSPQRRINVSMGRQGGNLEDISEIEYANLSGSFHPYQSVRNQVTKTPKSLGQIRMEASMRDNLEDISEIDYADLSGTNQSIRNQQTSFRSPQQRMQTSARQSPRAPSRQQPTEGILIDITSTPPKTPQRNVVFNDGNLMQFDNEPVTQSSSRQPKKNGNLKELIRQLSSVLNDDLSSRLKRREKVHDRSLPHRKQKSVSKKMNTSFPTKPPVTSNRIVFDRPVRVVPSRIHEDLPIPMTSVVIERPREALSPLRPHEAQRINQMLLESTVNPFAGNNNMLQIPAASRSFYEDQGNSSFRNTSLPLHLTPRKEKLPDMEKSFTAAWEETQRSNQVAVDDEDLQNISDPFSASMDESHGNQYSYKEDLQNVSQPFSESFNEMYDSGSNLVQQLPVQSAGQYLSNFDQNDDLENVSFELQDD